MLLRGKSFLWTLPLFRHSDDLELKITMVTMKEIRTVEDMKSLLTDLGLNLSEHFLVKPNWFFAGKGFYTDAKTLEILFKCLNKITVIESYTYVRNDGSRTITPENDKNNWSWIREQDKQFLTNSGLKELFREYDVEYVNLTEEVWSNRVANSENVRKCIEAEFSPVKEKQLYEQVPQIIYDLRGKKLISYAKIKVYRDRVFRISGTLKNIFGNIVDPNRHRYHGEKDCDLSQSIVDINKIYASLFVTVGLTEGIYTAVRYTKDGKYPLPWGFRYDLIENLRLVICEHSLVSVDAFISQLCGIDPATIEQLDLAAKVFGKWPQDIVEQAKRQRAERYYML